MRSTPLHPDPTGSKLPINKETKAVHESTLALTASKNNPLTKDKAGVRKKYSRKLILVLAFLALTLSIGSIRWITEKKAPANTPIKVEAVIPEQKELTTKKQDKETVQEEKKTPSTSIVHKEDAAKKIRKNWTKYITASNSNYGYGVLGGIDDLSIEFSNKTDYALDEMTAKVVYVKSNGKPWITKYVTVLNVPPHSQRKQALPKVSRGKSVQVSITKVVSSKMHFFYTPERAAAKADDPYFMQ
jgi:hypothetical protein